MCLNLTPHILRHFYVTETLRLKLLFEADRATHFEWAFADITTNSMRARMIDRCLTSGRKMAPNTAAIHRLGDGWVELSATSACLPQTATPRLARRMIWHRLFRPQFRQIFCCRLFCAHYSSSLFCKCINVTDRLTFILPVHDGSARSHLSWLTSGNRLPLRACDGVQEHYCTGPVEQTTVLITITVQWELF